MKHYVLVFFILIVCATDWANAQQKKETLLISTADEGPIIAWYKNYIARAYDKLGIDIDFKFIPTGREGVEAEKGYVDALTIRVSSAESSFSDFIRVPVILSKGELSLYCQKDVHCDSDVLMRPNVTIGVVSGSNASTFYMKDKAAHLYHVKSGKALAELLYRQRFKYIISIDSPDFGNYASIDPNTYSKVKLTNIEAYHYLHKKHQDLLPKVTLALQEAIKEIGPLPVQQLRDNLN